MKVHMFVDYTTNILFSEDCVLIRLDGHNKKRYQTILNRLFCSNVSGHFRMQKGRIRVLQTSLDLCSFHPAA